MRCSNNIRSRVVAFVRGGGNKAEAARRFQVSRTSVYPWVKAADALSYQKPGPKQGWRLDWEALRRQVEEHADLTQQERAQQFSATLLFLPPYSPDLNPIEHDFAALKKQREYTPDETLDNITRMYK